MKKWLFLFVLVWHFDYIDDCGFLDNGDPTCHPSMFYENLKAEIKKLNRHHAKTVDIHNDVFDTAGIQLGQRLFGVRKSRP